MRNSTYLISISDRAIQSISIRDEEDAAEQDNLVNASELGRDGLDALDTQALHAENMNLLILERLGVVAGAAVLLDIVGDSALVWWSHGGHG